MDQSGLARGLSRKQAFHRLISAWANAAVDHQSGGTAKIQLEINTKGVDFVVPRALQPKYDNDGQQKVDRETGVPLHVTELVAMDDTGAEMIKVTIVGEPRGAGRQLVTMVKLVATPWNIRRHGTPRVSR